MELPVARLTVCCLILNQSPSREESCPWHQDWLCVLPWPMRCGCRYTHHIQAGVLRASVSSAIFPLSIFYETFIMEPGAAVSGAGAPVNSKRILNE